MRIAIQTFTKYFLALLLTGITLTIFNQSAAAQFGTNKPHDKKISPVKKRTQEKIKKKTKSAEPSELDEALSFLKEKGEALASMPVYRLAGTKQQDIAPQIADTVISSGESAKRLEKIAEKILGYHKLSEECAVVLFESEVPTVFTYRLRSISFSTSIFKILTDDEAAALIAHEIGHLFLGKELAESRDNKDDRLARIIELKCDVISLITLKKLKINPAVLITAIKKLIRAREKLGLETDSDQSPSLKDRIKLSKKFNK